MLAELEAAERARRGGAGESEGGDGAVGEGFDQVACGVADLVLRHVGEIEGEAGEGADGVLDEAVAESFAGCFEEDGAFGLVALGEADAIG